MNKGELEENLVEGIRKAVTSVTEETEDALREAKDREEKEGAQVQLDAILENIDVGKSEKRPICQDTGTQTFFIEVGEDFKWIGQLKRTVDESVKRATETIPLRPNAIDPISDENSGDNTGRFIPSIHWDIVKGDEAIINIIPKGGGSENMSRLEMMTPGRGLKGVKEIVLDQIAEMAGKPCPPTIVGIGLGGGADLAMELAKKALLRPVGERHAEGRIAELEEELLEKANELGVGPMGVGGKTTVLDVKIEYAHRHPASYPVAVLPQCWANRQAKLKVSSNGEVEVVR
ncbi:MAG: fumarate hydratase [Candidatus Thermoplasmatota archaeon]|nr:fumarate hydratase [Candidatus Thermoplasmatota archaeon]MBS3789322.1 fumarate hydratase [Candidatus Thermoplasmatota archaeon]